MKEVKVQKRYQCDFCKHRSVKWAMEAHEKICYRNPNRFCELCENTGTVSEEVNDGCYNETPCIYCKRFDKKMLEEIKEREKREIE